MELKDLLKVMIEKDGSDLFLTTGAPPSMKAMGQINADDRQISPSRLYQINRLFHHE